MIDPSPTALDGSVTHLAGYDTTNFSNTDAILCRITAPLVSMAFGFIRRGVGVRILGREIGQGLVALVNKMKAENVEELQQRLGAWSSREAAKCRNRGHEQAAATVEEKFECILIFIDQLTEPDRTVKAVIRSIESLFTNNNEGLLTLCTVHKAKGLEWNSVFILDRYKYMPSKYAKQDWEHIQEKNIVYVAITRARLDLVYIESSQWRKPKPEEIKQVVNECLDDSP